LLITSCGQQDEPKRVGMLLGLPGVDYVGENFKTAMAELGYVENENITYDIRVMGFDVEAQRAALQDFVDQDVDLIFVFPTEPTVLAKEITAGTDIPVVFTNAWIDGLGIVDSIREPGGNLTGARYPTDIPVGRFEVMMQLVPDAKRILIPYIDGYPISQPQLDAIAPVAEARGVTIVPLPVTTTEELVAGLEQLVTEDGVNIDGILHIAGPLVGIPGMPEALLAFGEEHQLPMGGSSFFSEGYNSIFAYENDLFNIGIDVAPTADKILQGVDPGSIPVTSSEGILTVLLYQIEALGLEAPEELLISADMVLREPFVFEPLPEGEAPADAPPAEDEAGG
jgi:putative ABC transport system substrate-binding protein